MHVPPITITDRDFERLQQLLTGYVSPAAENLDAELARARVVGLHEVPAEIVTMNSDVLYEDTSSQAQRLVRVVFPKDADADRGWVSVLAPLGSALLGLRVGQEIDWRMPGGVRRVRVLAVPYQPEAAGHHAL